MGNDHCDFHTGCAADPGSAYPFERKVNQEEVNMKENVILEIRHLQKGYKKFPVLKDVTFQVQRGHILGLIGKNGAGKTTLMKSVLGLNTNYQGEIFFHGEKMDASSERMKSKIGSLVDVSFYDDMTAFQNMKTIMMLTKAVEVSKQNQRIKELLSFVGLENAGKKSVRSFSFGMKQRLALAQTLITKPDLLVLDEPFVGLDPVGIEDVKKLLQQLCRENHTSIIFSSHQLNEVCDLADDIAVLSEGTIKYSDTCKNMTDEGRSLVELMR